MDRRDSLRPNRTPTKGTYVSPYAMETPMAMSSPSASVSSDGSLTSKSTAELEQLAPLDMMMGNTPPRTGSARNTPHPELGLPQIGHELPNTNNFTTDAEHIVVEIPAAVFDKSINLDVEEDDDAEDEEEAISAPQQPKRKRTSVNYILDDPIYPAKVRTGEPRTKRRHGPKVRGIIIGVWRDSSEPVDEEKHVIFGFIDIHDRLRTRIYSMNRRGEELIGNAPTGAGGCWVTFERVIFEPHLRGLNTAQIKEYVKLRAEIKLEDDLEERRAAELDAVALAKVNANAVATNPPETKLASHMRRSIGNGRASVGRESVGASTPPVPRSVSGFQAVNSPHIQSYTPKIPAESRSTTGVPLGYWIDSDEPELVNKHAVVGVLSETDCFRVKVQKNTRDGRYLEGNYPSGIGAMWIKFEQLVFEPHLSILTRPEVKEFVRIRQRQLAGGQSESPKQRQNNEMQAIQDAKFFIAAQGGSFIASAPTNGSGFVASSSRASPEPEVRHSARSELKQAARLQVEAEASALRARQEKAKALSDRHEQTRKEVAIAEALVKERAEKELNHNINHLNKIWVAQQNATKNGVSPASSNFGGASSSVVVNGNGNGNGNEQTQQEVKFHNGIRYERRTQGPFAGKLVGTPQIFSIDGEDFVEYRILTKPSFA